MVIKAKEANLNKAYYRKRKRGGGKSRKGIGNIRMQHIEGSP